MGVYRLAMRKQRPKPTVRALNIYWSIKPYRLDKFKNTMNTLQIYEIMNSKPHLMTSAEIHFFFSLSLCIIYVYFDVAMIVLRKT